MKEPLFVVPGLPHDGGSGTYYGLGYTVEVEKHIDVAYRLCVDSVEMKMLGKVVSASIS